MIADGSCDALYCNEERYNGVWVYLGYCVLLREVKRLYSNQEEGRGEQGSTITSRKWLKWIAGRIERSTVPEFSPV